MNLLTEAGWDPYFESIFQNQTGRIAAGGPADELVPARVTAMYGESCQVICEAGEQSAYLAGRLLDLAGPAEHKVTTGDWVVARRPEGADFLLIEGLLERRTSLSRKSPGGGPAQMMAANVDRAFLVQGLDRDYNPRRLERYLALVYGGGVEPCIVLNKCDLLNTEERAAKVEGLRAVAGEAPIVLCSATTGEGLEELETFTAPGRTFCFLGSSGAGKSTLVNRLLGYERQATGALSELYGKGRHTTTIRELIVLLGRGVLIDTPGLREVALDDSADLAAVFPEIEELAPRCRFRDCTHESEPDCAVRAAVERGELSADRLKSYFRLLRETARLKTPETEREARQKRREEHKAAKDTGKLYKNIMERKRRERGR